MQSSLNYMYMYVPYIAAGLFLYRGSVRIFRIEEHHTKIKATSIDSTTKITPIRYIIIQVLVYLLSLFLFIQPKFVLAVLTIAVNWSL